MTRPEREVCPNCGGLNVTFVTPPGKDGQWWCLSCEWHGPHTARVFVSKPPKGGLTSVRQHKFDNWGGENPKAARLDVKRVAAALEPTAMDLEQSRLDLLALKEELLNGETEAEVL